MKQPEPLIPLVDVLAWLGHNHPDLHASAHTERNWVWLTADLSGEPHRKVRNAIKQFGFRFARNGHTLPNGVVAYWAHHGEKPIPFRRRKRNAPGAWSKGPGENVETLNEIDDRAAALKEALAALSAA